MRKKDCRSIQHMANETRELEVQVMTRWVQRVAVGAILTLFTVAGMLVWAMVVYHGIL